MDDSLLQGRAQMQTPPPVLRREPSWEAGLLQSEEFRYERLVHVHNFLLVAGSANIKIPLLVIPSITPNIDLAKEAILSMQSIADTVLKSSVYMLSRRNF